MKSVVLVESACCKVNGVCGSFDISKLLVVGFDTNMLLSNSGGRW